MSPQRRLEGVASDNIGGPSLLRLVRDFWTLAAVGVRRIGWQEAGDRAGLFAAIGHRTATVAAALVGWRTYRPKAAGAGSVPISWHRRTYRALARGWHECAPARRLGPAGAGPTWSKVKGVLWVRLEHRASGVRELHLNTHLIPSAERRDLPDAEHQARLELFHDHIAGIVGLVHELRTRFPNDRLILTLDANAVARSRLLSPLHRIGFRGWTLEGTEGDRNIDHVLVLDPQERPIGQVDVSGRSSSVPELAGDHRKPVRWLPYRLKRQSRRSRP